jgi:hypothetical protein
MLTPGLLTRHRPLLPGCRLFEIDLHSLHAQAATAALDRRLALLHSLLTNHAAC